MSRKRPLVDLSTQPPRPRTGELADLFTSEPDARARLQDVPIEAIEPDPRQPRTTFDDGSLSDLAHSLQQDGLIQPIEVIQIDRGRYRLVHGERRWRAAQRVGWTTISAIVRQRDYDEVTRFVRQLVENIQREDLNDIDRAAGLVRLRDMLQEELNAQAERGQEPWSSRATWAKVAERLGYTRQRVSQLTRLMQLPEPIQQSIIDGTISERDTRIYHGLTPRQQRALHRARVVEGMLTQGDAKRVADYLKQGESRSVEDAIQAVLHGIQPPGPAADAPRAGKFARALDQAERALGVLQRLAASDVDAAGDYLARLHTLEAQLRLILRAARGEGDADDED